MATAPGGRAGDAMAGSTFWMAPEVVTQQTHGAPADVWSDRLILAIEMLTYAAVGGAAVVQAIFIGGTESSATVPIGYPI